MRSSIFLCIFLFIVFGACKKNSVDNANSDVKIELVSGNNQSDTVGRVLKDTLQFKITRAGVPLPGAFIEIILGGCRNSLRADTRGYVNGQFYFPWQLNNTVGRQSIIVYVLDSLGHKLDSTSANATGIAYDHGWMPGQCMPDNFFGFLGPLHILSTGRILTYGPQSLYYSDDNGASWSVLSSFPDNNGQDYELSTYGTNVFALNGLNLFYSPDNGASWQSLKSVQNILGIKSMEFTKSGKLFMCSYSAIYRSTDFLKTWQKTAALPLNGFHDVYSLNPNLAEAPDGSLFIISGDGNLFQSDDDGVTWLKYNFSDQVMSVFADDNGDIYVGGHGLKEDIYRMSKPSAAGYTIELIASLDDPSSTSPGIFHITKVNNNYYFLSEGNGLMKTGDFKSFYNVKPGPIMSYCISNSNAAIVIDNGRNVFYNFKWPTWIEYNLNP